MFFFVSFLFLLGYDENHTVMVSCFLGRDDAVTLLNKPNFT